MRIVKCGLFGVKCSTNPLEGSSLQEDEVLNMKLRQVLDQPVFIGLTYLGPQHLI